MLPEIKVTDQLSFSTYFIYIGLLYTYLVYWVYASAHKKKLDVLIALNLSLIIMVIGFIGARLTHVLWESPEVYSEHPSTVFKFWQGGFVFYGGAIPAVLACLWYLKKQKQKLTTWLDFFAPIGALGYGLGRISCFLAGCCYGKSCDLPWAIQGRHPTPLYAVTWELSVLVYLNWRGRKKLSPGQLFAEWILLHSVGRMIMESFRDDFRGDFIFGISPSTLISLILFSGTLAYFAISQIKVRSN